MAEEQELTAPGNAPPPSPAPPARHVSLTPASAAILTPWASLAIPGFRLLWIGSPFATMGGWMRQFVNLYMVYQISGSTIELGILGLFQGIPALITSPIGGTVVDRMNPKRVLQAAQVVNLCIGLTLAILALTDNLQVWHFYALTFAQSLPTTFEQPARMSLVPSLVPPSHMVNAVTLQSGATQGAMLIAPLLGGSLLAWMTPSAAYFTSASLIVPAMVAVFFLRPPAQVRTRRPPFTFRGVTEGLRFFVRTEVLLAFILLDTVAMVFGFFQALLPVFAKDILGVGPGGLGVLGSSFSVGAVIAFAILAVVGGYTRKGLLMLAVIFLYGLALLGFGLSSWYALSIITIGAMGFLDGVSVSVRQASFLLLSPEELRGRAMSVILMFAIAANSLGGAYAGFMANAVGAQTTMAMGGGVSMAMAAAVFLTRRKVRDFRA